MRCGCWCVFWGKISVCGVLWCGGGCLWCVVVCCGEGVCGVVSLFVSVINGVRLELVFKILLLFSYIYVII